VPRPARGAVAVSAFLQPVLRQALGAPALTVTDTQPVAGGCIHHAARLQTSAGVFFAKWNADCPADLFICEAKALDALRGAGWGLVVPRVVAATGPTAEDPAFLVLEWLPPAPRQDDERLGRGLAALHRTTAPRFGFPSPTYCGATRQDNREHDTWAAFYAEQRLRPLLDALSAAGRLAAAERRVYERLIDRLPALLPRDATPSLVHGDLWSGNVLATSGGPALVDPACAYADREMELGITTLFGGLSERALAAYEEAWPLPAGWRERNGLYQLYHLLNHALLFGGHYASEARRAAGRYV
jgi:protein-ribulosamine 3-kinase